MEEAAGGRKVNAAELRQLVDVANLEEAGYGYLTADGYVNVCETPLFEERRLIQRVGARKLNEDVDLVQGQHDGSGYTERVHRAPGVPKEHYARAGRGERRAAEGGTVGVRAGRRGEGGAAGQ